MTEIGEDERKVRGRENGGGWHKEKLLGLGAVWWAKSEGMDMGRWITRSTAQNISLKYKIKMTFEDKTRAVGSL